MRTAVVLIITVALMALQFYFGMRKKMMFGAILPVGFLSIAIWMLVSKAADPMAVFVAAAAFAAIWFIGYSNAKKVVKNEMDKMKAKDIDG